MLRQIISVTVILGQYHAVSRGLYHTGARYVTLPLDINYGLNRTPKTTVAGCSRCVSLCLFGQSNHPFPCRRKKSILAITLVVQLGASSPAIHGGAYFSAVCGWNVSTRSNFFLPQTCTLLPLHSGHFKWICDEAGHMDLFLWSWRINQNLFSLRNGREISSSVYGRTRRTQL